MLERNLLYTGVTRGKGLVVLIGQEKALRIAIRTMRSRKRLTNLSARLRQAEQAHVPVDGVKGDGADPETPLFMTNRMAC
jgi:hypothetical protein